MKKYVILSLFSIFLLNGCKKEPAVYVTETQIGYVSQIGHINTSNTVTISKNMVSKSMGMGIRYTIREGLDMKYLNQRVVYSSKICATGCDNRMVPEILEIKKF